MGFVCETVHIQDIEHRCPAYGQFQLSMFWTSTLDINFGHQIDVQIKDSDVRFKDRDVQNINSDVRDRDNDVRNTDSPYSGH